LEKQGKKKGEKIRSGEGAPENSGQDSREDQVRLRPVLGIPPGLYLSFLYSLVLIVLLFFLLCYPGLRRPGSLVTIRSDPAGAAIRVDGETRGATPGEIFIPRGDRVIEISLPGFSPHRTKVAVKGRSFGSLFFPRRFSVVAVLRAADPPAVFAEAAGEYAAWSFAGEPTAAWQIPRSLSEGAYRVGPAARDPAIYAAMGKTLEGCLGFAVTKAALRDLIRAKMLTDNGGLSPSPLSLIGSLEDIMTILSGVPGSAPWLADLLPPEAAALVAGSAWYAKTVMAAAASEAGVVPREARGFGGRLELGGLPFREVFGGTFQERSVFPHTEETGDFWIALTALPLASWEAFLRENPRWDAENTADLAEQGLVTGDYLLREPGPPGRDRRDGASAVTGVSWYAAEAYCRWLTTLLPRDLAGWEVRLPTEAEWEYALRLRAAAGDLPGLPEGFLRGFWEWCGDPYVPLNFFPPAPSPERALRGGSWINSPDQATPETRASLPPEFCSPFVSFRPVIAPKRETRP
jgi:formylglycine-generating enzyme required for sulfatase activity